MRDRPLAVVLTGPTAVGKTALSLSLSDALNAELISVDSAQVYRGMDIGTAKPSCAVRARYPHRLIDIRDPAEPYSAAEFRADCRLAIDDILANGRTPLLVGGTMLYLRALFGGLADLPPADAVIRAEVLASAERFGWAALHAELSRVDPVTAARLHPTDSQRIQRALEVYRLTGRPLSAAHAAQRPPDELPCRFVQIALLPLSRAMLHRRIAQRFEQMLAEGLVEEVQGLFERADLGPEIPSIRSVGYRQVWSFLSGEYDHRQMTERAIIATRQLAKRQHTWLRSWPDMNVLVLDETGSVCSGEGPGIGRGETLPSSALEAALGIIAAS